MKSRATTVAAASVAATLLLALTGCSGGSAESGTTIEFQTNATVDSKLMIALEEVTAAFEEANPGVTIDLVAPSSQYEADMKVRLAAGDAPDIFATHGWSLLRYSEFLEPLQNEAWAANFNPALDSAMRNDAGEFFALPIDTDVAGIIYNADVLTAAGVDPDSISTWDDFAEAAAAVDASGIAPIAVSGKDGGPAGNLTDWIVAGAYTPEQLDELSAGSFVDAPYATTLDLIDGWRTSGYFNPDYSSATSDDVSRALADGNAAFVFSQNQAANNALQYNPDANLGFMPVPSLTEQNPYLVGGEFNAFGISKTSEHLDDAKAYLAFLAQPENITVLAESVGNLPGLTDASADLGPLQESFDTHVISGSAPLVPYFDRVYLPNGMWNTMVTTTDSIITGQSSVDQAVTQVDADFTSLWGQS